MGIEREIASQANGKLGGRPLSKGTLVARKMREKITLVVEKNFIKLVKPQMKKAIKGDYTAYRDLMDRAGVKPEEEGPKVAVQINIAQILDRHENK